MEEKDDSIIFDENSEIKEEIQNSSLIQANILFKLFSATCQIITSRGNGSGFFLKLKNYPLYCLLSNEHIITKKIIILINIVLPSISCQFLNFILY